MVQLCRMYSSYYRSTSPQGRRGAFNAIEEELSRCQGTVSDFVPISLRSDTSVKYPEPTPSHACRGDGPTLLDASRAASDFDIRIRKSPALSPDRNISYQDPPKAPDSVVYSYSYGGQ